MNFVIVIFCALSNTVGGFWFLSDLPLTALSTSNSLPCENFPGLSKTLLHLCIQQPEVVLSIGEGIRLGLDECQSQFKDQRWNCSLIHSQNQAAAQRAGKLALKVGTRESAFVHSISSAGVVHSIARSCSSGELSNCSCDRDTHTGRQKDEKGEFQWTGCDRDSVRYAVKLARKYVSSEESDHHRQHHKFNDGRSLINQHNNRVGRKVVQNNLVKECKCHGVSGSCAVRTCWLNVPSFHQIGDILRKKYDYAYKVQPSEQGKFLSLAEKLDQSPKRTDLVFHERSPDYCSSNLLTGSTGTGGRVCKVNSTDSDSCDILCCGRGYDTRRTQQTKTCHCKFRWCCRVECEQCAEIVEEYVCKPDNQSKKLVYQRIVDKGRITSMVERSHNSTYMLRRNFNSARSNHTSASDELSTN